MVTYLLDHWSRRRVSDSRSGQPQNSCRFNGRLKVSSQVEIRAVVVTWNIGTYKTFEAWLNVQIKFSCEFKALGINIVPKEEQKEESPLGDGVRRALKLDSIRFACHEAAVEVKETV